MTTEKIPARELVVGDIVTETVGVTTFRKIVVNMTRTSAVTKSDSGQDGRIAFTRKVRKQPVDVEAEKIGHRDLRAEELAALRGYYRLGEYNKALFRAGLYQGLPRMAELFGYAEGEESPLYVAEGDVVNVVRSSGVPEGDKVEIMRQVRKNYGKPGYPEEATYGARVVDGEHGIVVGYVRGSLPTQEAAEEAADMYLGKRYFDGWDIEEALQQARFLSDILK